MITPNTPTPAPTTRSWIVMLTQLLCKLNLHHHWHVDHNDDGGLYKRCLHCGKDSADGDGAANDWALRRWW